jgi:O-antigen ligase
MTTWQDWLFGKGLWSENDFWSCSLDWYPEHLHSIFMDAFVRGGLLGLAGLLLIIGWALRRAFLLARAGEELWLVLASFGITGLVFDGDSAFSLLTLPRFETLLLWVPLVIASARYQIVERLRNDFAKSAITA